MSIIYALRFDQLEDESAADRPAKALLGGMRKKRCAAMVLPCLRVGFEPSRTCMVYDTFRRLLYLVICTLRILIYLVIYDSG